MENNETRFLYAGDTALVIEFGNAINETLNARVRNVYNALKAMKIDGVYDVIPTFRSILINYLPDVITFDKLRKRLNKVLNTASSVAIEKKRVIVVPVAYGGVYGEDIKDVCAHTGLDESEVIKLHSSTTYLIYMLGFLPGFAYLGGLDKRLVTPRLKNPRTKIEAGAVGIGGEQTGVYPLASPGGWRLIGRTPLKPYDPHRESPFLYKAGDYIKFRPVTIAEYELISNAVASGSYICEEDII
ncbi:MAG: 5-oxoprolinase subunit PxpB [Christensenellaceae bacterium]|jgi:KipI family sensor histidine kinase inhibitor|nr:5-oxoprolinase subunit PxpB [Christensenellaceae bacterium]